MTAGVYQIYNRFSRKRYIGSAKSVERRVVGHFKALEKGNHHSDHLQHAYNKYGRKAFTWSILKKVKAPARETLLTAEQHWLDYYRCYCGKFGYNICSKAGSTLGVPHSAKTKRKISVIAKQKFADGTRVHPRPNAGRRFSKKWLRNISKARKKFLAGGGTVWNSGLKGAYAHSEERRLKIAVAVKHSWDEGRMQGSRGSKRPLDEVKRRAQGIKESWKRRERMPKDLVTGRFVVKKGM